MSFQISAIFGVLGIDKHVPIWYNIINQDSLIDGKGNEMKITITNPNNNTPFEVKLNRWQKHGRDNVYVEGFKFHYDMISKSWVGRIAPQLSYVQSAVEAAIKSWGDF